MAGSAAGEAANNTSTTRAVGGLDVALRGEGRASNFSKARDGVGLLFLFLATLCYFRMG